MRGLFMCCIVFFFFFKQKTAYEIRNCDWSSDVCSSDLTKLMPYLSFPFPFPVGAVVKVCPFKAYEREREREIGRASCRERV